MDTLAIIPARGGSKGLPRKNLADLGLIEALTEEIMYRKKPFLGICLGMQLLAKSSEEHGHTVGLGLIDSQIKKFSISGNKYKIPHVGWNDITLNNNEGVLHTLQTGKTYYFVHSYYMENSQSKDVLATCEYGEVFTAAIKKDNIFATQFHPEKSGKFGINILRKFFTEFIN